MKLEHAPCPIVSLTETIGGGFFGYFDKSPWPPDGSDRLLLHRAPFEHRMPLAGEPIEIGLLEQGHYRALGTSTAWNFQQGAMLQWLPGTADTIVYNDMGGTDPVARRLDTRTGDIATLARPIAALSPTGREALSLNFGRINALKPEYGYAGALDNTEHSACPDRDGLWRIDMETGGAELLLSTSAVARCAPETTMSDAIHYLNHPLYSPDGGWFCFLHRWIDPAKTQRTRLLAARRDGSELRVLISGMASHMGWRNSHQLLAWAGERRLLAPAQQTLLRRLPVGRMMGSLYRRLGKPASLKAAMLGDGYILFDTWNGRRTRIGSGALSSDGHCSFRRDGDWLVTDTYPDRHGKAALIIASLAQDRAYRVHDFQFPTGLDDEIRCDLHPRWHPTQPLICVDYMAGGKRHMGQVDVSAIIAA